MSRGRPPGTKNKRKEVEAPKIQRMTRDPSPKKVCSCCQKNKSVRNYYKSFNVALHSDGYLPYCKDCLIDLCIDPDTKNIDNDRLQDVLRQCDRPWDEGALAGAYKEFENSFNPELEPYERSKIVLARLWKNVQSLPQYNMSWQDYEEKKRLQALGNIKDEPVYAAQPITTARRLYERPIYLEDIEEEEFQVTPAIIRKYGQGYTQSEYKAMEEKYAFLSKSYPDLTNLHTEALITYIRYKVKEEFANAAGDVDAAEKWAGLATKAADKAKINPSQLSQSDLQGGLNSFSELMMAVEQAVDIIPILPQFKFRQQDAVDFTIWCYVNYIRKTEGKPECSYEDIYHFYDEKKAEYIAQYGDPTGIFTDDPTEKNRASIEKFITMPKEYGDADGSRQTSTKSCGP